MFERRCEGTELRFDGETDVEVQCQRPATERIGDFHVCQECADSNHVHVHLAAA